MTDVEKQESQKTVVAFITGLLIGGLLVWVFSSSPAESPVIEIEGDTTTESETQTENTTTETKGTESETVSAAPEMVIGEGSIAVTDQKAGNTVMLGALKFPAKSGWVVVRDYKDNTPGNVLGAARFSSDEGLAPTQVELMRETTASNTYQVVFYTNTGAPEFKLGEDVVVNGPSATFKAN